MLSLLKLALWQRAHYLWAVLKVKDRFRSYLSYSVSIGLGKLYSCSADFNINTCECYTFRIIKVLPLEFYSSDYHICYFTFAFRYHQPHFAYLFSEHKSLSLTSNSSIQTWPLLHVFLSSHEAEHLTCQALKIFYLTFKAIDQTVARALLHFFLYFLGTSVAFCPRDEKHVLWGGNRSLLKICLFSNTILPGQA